MGWSAEPTPARRPSSAFVTSGAALDAAGAAKTDVAKVNVYLTKIGDRAAVAESRTRFFGDHRPAATLVEVSALAQPELLVEIDAIAVVPS